MIHGVTTSAIRAVRLAGLLTLTLALGGCGVWDFVVGKDKDKLGLKDVPIPKEVAMPVPADSRVEVLITASPMVNPDLDGRASPVVVRLYQLASAEAFKEADFSSLYEADEKALGKSMLGRIEMIMEPGGVKAIATKANTEVAFMGVVVAYRKYETAKWRALYPLQGDKRTKVRADILRLSVDLRDEE